MCVAMWHSPRGSTWGVITDGIYQVYFPAHYDVGLAAEEDRWDSGSL